MLFKKSSSFLAFEAFEISNRTLTITIEPAKAQLYDKSLFVCNKQYLYGFSIHFTPPYTVVYGI